MPTVSQCFSALVASGNGQSCNKVLGQLHSQLNEIEETTGLNKSFLYKNCKKEHPEQHKEIRIQVAEILDPYLVGMDLFYFGDDLNKEITCSN